MGKNKSAQVHIRFLEGDDAGVQEWVPRARLLAPWDDLEAWLRDEERLAAVTEVSWRARDTAEYDAAQLVLESSEVVEGIHLGYSQPAAGSIQIKDLGTVATVLDLSPATLLVEPLAFVDRFGTYVAPWAVALRVAKLRAEVKADTILGIVSDEEAELAREAIHGKVYRSGRRPYLEVDAERCAQYQKERQPVLDLVREWCGSEATERFDELIALRAEVKRLNDLVTRSLQALRDHGQPSIAAALEGELHQLAQIEGLRAATQT